MGPDDFTETCNFSGEIDGLTMDVMGRRGGRPRSKGGVRSEFGRWLDAAFAETKAQRAEMLDKLRLQNATVWRWEHEPNPGPRESDMRRFREFFDERGLPPAYPSFFATPFGTTASDAERRFLQSYEIRSALRRMGLVLTPSTLQLWLAGVRAAEKAPPNDEATETHTQQQEPQARLYVVPVQPALMAADAAGDEDGDDPDAIMRAMGKAASLRRRPPPKPKKPKPAP